jgi:asparagine synthase (glutamine-hydrolysing)
LRLESGDPLALCGIAGIYAYRRASNPIDRDELRRIRDHMTFRGPDGVGEWLSADGRIGFGHRRLSIIDLSQQGAQPMQSADGKLVVTFNGEIYNYRRLRAELEARGHLFRTQSDTEVLLQLYAEKGESMVQDLRGMFAFGLWDSVKRELLLARDPYGIKPLYYSDDGQCLRFASQVKALTASELIGSALDPAGLVGFCLFGSVPEPFTINKEVRALPAGCTLRVRESSRAEPKPYFSICKVFADAVSSSKADTIHEAPQVVRDALRDSIQHHLVADVPVGMFLSAGIDSGVVAGLSAEVLRPKAIPLKTLNVAFEEFRDRSDDEAPVASEIARLFGTDHSVRVVQHAEFESDLPRIFAAMDQPTIDGVNTWFASKAAHELGLKVVLSGLGGDELFGGYPSFRDLPLWVNALRLPSGLPGLGPSFRRAYGVMSQVMRLPSPKAAGLFEYGGSYPGAYLLRRGLFMPWELPRLLGDELAREGLTRLDPLAYIAGALSPDPEHPFARVAALEASLYMRNQLLRDTDWASMAHSLEVRVPLVDRILFEALAPLLVAPDRAAGKTWLSLAPCQKLPERVVKRPKTGFVTPINQWLVRSKSYHEATIRAKLPPKTHWSRRWGLAVLSHFAPDSAAIPAAA